MKREGEVLLAVDPDGTTRRVPNTYEGVKDGLRGATLDYVRPNSQAGFYVDDEGMLNGALLNIVGSLMSGMCLYGPVVLCAADPDDDGDTVPPDEMSVNAALGLAEAWRHVVADAERKGQGIAVAAEPGRIPPPQFVAFENDDEMMRYLFGQPDA